MPAFRIQSISFSVRREGMRVTETFQAFSRCSSRLHSAAGCILSAGMFQYLIITPLDSLICVCGCILVASLSHSADGVVVFFSHVLAFVHDTTTDTTFVLHDT